MARLRFALYSLFRSVLFHGTLTLPTSLAKDNKFMDFLIGDSAIYYILDIDETKRSRQSLRYYFFKFSH